MPDASGYLLVAAGIAPVFLVGVWRRWGASLSLLTAAVGALCLLPGTVLGGQDPSHIGIASSSIALTTYQAPVLLAAVYALWRTRRLATTWLWTPLLGFLVLGAVLWWSGSASTWSGVLLLVTAVAAWHFGAFLGSETADRSLVDRGLALLIAGVTAVQLVVSLAQWLGAPIFAMEARTQEFVGDRVSGTLDHPGDLGRMLLLLAIIALPLTISTDRVNRLASRISIPLMFLIIMLTESRTNLVAILTMMGLWLLAAPSMGPRTRKRALITAVVGIAAALPVLVTRFLEDPTGGERLHLLQVAIEGIPNNLWLGVGPNSYVDRFGEIDRLTASGWPVHNVVALVVAELGVIGATLFFAPPALLLTAVVAQRHAIPERDHARAALVAVPALGLVGFTGWGLMNGPSLILMFFIGGLVAQLVRAHEVLPEHYLASRADDRETVRFGMHVPRLAPGPTALTALSAAVVAGSTVLLASAIGTPPRAVHVTIPAPSDVQVWNGVTPGPQQTALTTEIARALATEEWPRLDPPLTAVAGSSPVDEKVASCTPVDVEDLEGCSWGAGGRSAQRAVLVGDTASMTYASTLQQVLETERGWRLYSRGTEGCAFSTQPIDQLTESDAQRCERANHVAVRHIRSLEPELLIVSNSYFPHTLNGVAVSAQTEAEGVQELITQVRSSVGRVVLLAPPPLNVQVHECYAAESRPERCVSRVTRTWQERADAERALAEDLNSRWLDSRPWFCVDGHCPAFVGATPTTARYGFTTVDYAERLAPIVAEVLDALEVLESP